MHMMNGLVPQPHKFFSRAARTDPHNSYDYDYNDIITVIVGISEQQFIVHKTTICEKSKFFHAACSNVRWREGKEELVRLPEVHPRVFKAYAHWAYTGKVSPEVEWGHADVGEAEEQQTYVEAYIIGDLLDDRDLRQQVIDTMIKKTSTWMTMFSSGRLRRIWAKTPAGSPLRTFILEWKLYEGCPQSIAVNLKTPHDYPDEYLRELLVMLLTEVRKTPKTTRLSFENKLRQQLLPNLN